MRIGSLFSGYGGLDMAVLDVLGGTVAWHCDNDPAAARVLAHHWPDVPNLGDVTTVDWGAVEPVDVLTGGYPCQPFSHAGQRRGADDERHLWPHVREAIRRLRPRIAVLENVAGHRSMGFDRVLGDMAEDGLYARWVSVRASDVGAPHRRERIFIVAYPADTDLPRLEGAQPARRPDVPAGGDRGTVSLLKTPTAQLGTNGGAQHPDKRKMGGHGPTLADEVEHLLPTPAVNDMGAGKTVEAWDEWTAAMRARHGNGNGHGKNLAIEAQRLLPTPSANAPDITVSPQARALYSSGDRLGDIVKKSTWGNYAPAIARWWYVLGRYAPPATAGGRLSPRFVEWMMGLPDGHVTGVGLTRAQELKVLGNGVVPQQGARALRLLLGGAW